MAQDSSTIEYAENDTGAVATFTATDPEGESIVWSLATGGVDDMEVFSIENGVLRFKSSPDFEAPGDTDADNTYVVTVQASDGGLGTTAMEVVMVKVTNVEEPGTVTLTTLQPQVSEAIMATLTDPDNIQSDNLSSISWQWYRGNIPIAGATNGAGAITSMYTPAAGDVGSVLRATAMYDDAEGDDRTAQEDSAHAVREAPTSNVPPTFPILVGEMNTNQTREVAENTPAGTNFGAPVAASDTDVLTYSLDVPGAAFDINRATGQLITKVALDHEVTGSYTAMVKATDPFGAEVEAQVTITVTDVNEAPSVTGATSIDRAENGTDLDDNTTDLVAEDEFAVTDEDTVDTVGDLKWSLSGADASKFTFGDETMEMRTLAFKDNPDYESPGDSGANNVYEVTVVVTDTKGNTDEQTVMVKVTNIEEMGAITFSTLQPRVGFPVTATLTDPDNVNAGSVSWQWYRGGALQASSLSETDCVDANSDGCPIKDATSGTYRPAAGDARKRLTAVATYTDGSANMGDAKDVTLGEAANPVLVATLNQAPVFPDQDDEMEGSQTAQELTVGENVPMIGNVEATELVRIIGGPVIATNDDGGVLTYSLGGPNAASFSIIESSGQLQTKAVLDKETKDTYTVTVTATDSFGASSTITVTIRVDGVDEMPELVGEAPEEYAENGTSAVANFRATDPEGKSITWTMAGTDAAAFSIENGVLRFKSSPDYEDNNNTDKMYAATIRASDGGANTTATKEVTIEITNVEEPGTVTLDTLQPQVDVKLTATLADPDTIEGADLSTVTWQWYRGSSPISGATGGASSLTSDYIPDAGDVGSVLSAKAMYDDGEGDDKTARKNSYRNVRSKPADNNAPVFPDQNPGTEAIETNQTREVAENTPAGRNIGAPVAANDPGDVLTYSLDTEAVFAIVRSSGQLQTKADLDFEGGPSYTVTVTATDPFGSPDSSVVVITVTDVNEAPMLSGGATSIDRAENGTDLDDDTTGIVAEDEFAVTDEDTVDTAGDLKWSLSGADASKFDISANGGATRTLSLKEAPDYEAPGDSGRDNVYEVTVKVTDTKGNSDEQDVTVKVTNVEEGGMVTLSTLQPRVGFPVTATLADADNITAGSVSWQWYKGTVTEEQLASLDETECVDAASNTCFIKGATSATYTPVAFDVNDTVVAVALYTDGRPNEADAKDFAMMVTAEPVLADTRNKAPVFPDQDMEMDGRQTDQERTVLENVPVIGTEAATELIRTIGGPVIAMDFITVNAGITTPEILTYTLGGPDADSFSIDRVSAQLSTKVALDKETKDTYTVTVTATDPSGETATVMVTIKVTEVDEAPMIMVGGLAVSGMARVEYAEDGAEMVATYSASGPDADMATWMLEGDDVGVFDISSDGVLTFVRAPNYENQADADMDNVYQVTVEADDGTYMDTQDVTVTVINVDEKGAVTLSTADPRVDAGLTATLDDPDGGVTGTTWQWASSDAMDGAYTNIAGATSDSYTPVEGDATKYLRATASYTDAESSGKSAMEATANAVIAADAGDPLVNRYDANDNGIEKSEVLKAINDYLFGVGDEAITKAEVLRLINIYLFE